MCKFKGIVLKDDVNDFDCFERMLIAGLYVRCIKASVVKYLGLLEMNDGNQNDESPKIIHLKSEIQFLAHLIINHPSPPSRNSTQIPMQKI